MISTGPSCTLAKISFPSGAGTWFVIAKPSRSTQNFRHGSTASTMRTGVSCFSAGIVVMDVPGPLRLRAVAAHVGVEAGTEHAADDTEDSEIHTRLHCDIAVGGIRGFEHDRAIAVVQRLD